VYHILAYMVLIACVKPKLAVACQWSPHPVCLCRFEEGYGNKIWNPKLASVMRMPQQQQQQLYQLRPPASAAQSASARNLITECRPIAVIGDSSREAAC
jgi:hypothetical protein